MRKRLGTSKTTMVLLFTLMFMVALSAGFYKNTIAAESAKFKINLPGDGKTPVILDINKQGLPKKLIQPGLVTFSSGHGKGDIVNKGKSPIFVQLHFFNFPGKVEVNYRGPYDAATGKILKPLKPGEAISLDLGVELPKELRNKTVVFTGEIQFYDWKTNKMVGKIPVKVINSAYGTEPVTENSGNTDTKNSGNMGSGETCH